MVNELDLFEVELSEDELYEESQIILFGELTAYGEELYESISEMFYDEVDGKWIIIHI